MHLGAFTLWCRQCPHAKVKVIWGQMLKFTCKTLLLILNDQTWVTDAFGGPSRYGAFKSHTYAKVNSNLMSHIKVYLQDSCDK